MSTADHSTNGDGSASDIAARLREADFVRLVAMPDGDSLAATGVLARILDVPFQASITREAINESEADVTLSIGRSGGDSDVALTGEPIASNAVAVARVLDEAQNIASNEAVLALAGIVAAGYEPESHPEILETAGIDSRPGVGVPIDDLTDGLAHTTLVHTPFSGDREATNKALDRIADDDQTVASMLALSAIEKAETQASTAIERAINPYVLRTNTADEETESASESGTQSKFATLAGYADVLDALARSCPGVGLALALGYECYETALDGWREHAHTAHTAVHAADLVRYHGFSVAEVPSAVAGTGTIETVARLVRDYRSQEPVVLAIAGDEIAGAAIERDITSAATHAATAMDESVSAHGRYVYAQLSDDDEDVSESEENVDAFIDAFREAL